MDKPIGEILQLPQDVEQSIIQNSLLSGEPYIRLCGECGRYSLCFILLVKLKDIDEYNVVSKGMLVSVPKDCEIDEQIVTLLRFCRLVKYVKGEVLFYIPPSLSKPLYKYICRESSLVNLKVETLPIEETYTYLSDEDDYAEDEEMVK